jgi:hypothetical protein
MRDADPIFSQRAATTIGMRQHAVKAGFLRRNGTKMCRDRPAKWQGWRVFSRKRTTEIRPPPGSEHPSKAQEAHLRPIYFEKTRRAKLGFLAAAF